MFRLQEFMGEAQRKRISINRNGEFDAPKGTSWILSFVGYKIIEFTDDLSVSGQLFLIIYKPPISSFFLITSLACRS